MKSCVTVTIYSNSKEKIADCKNKLKSKLDEAYVKKRIEDYKEVVKSLTVNEVGLKKFQLHPPSPTQTLASHLNFKLMKI